MREKRFSALPPEKTAGQNPLWVARNASLEWRKDLFGLIVKGPTRTKASTAALRPIDAWGNREAVNSRESFPRQCRVPGRPACGPEAATIFRSGNSNARKR
jgi:hypothetical protein